MHVILHIGTPKTGTTAIQALFSTNRSILLRKFGICYADSGRVGRAHHNVAYQFGGEHLRTKFKPSLGGLKETIAEATAKGATACFISSEAVYQLRTQDLKALREAMAGYSVTIVVYLRRQDAYLQSGYQQVCKLGWTTEAPWEFCRRKHSLGHYDKRIATLQQLFGVNNIVARRFEPPNAGFDVCRDVCSIVGVKFESLKPPRPSPKGINASVGLKGLTFIRLLVISRTITKSVKPAPAFFQKVLAYFRAGGRDRYDFSLLSYNEAKALYDGYSASNCRLVRLLSADAESTFFPKAPTEGEYPGLPTEVHFSLQDQLFLRLLCLRHNLPYPPLVDPAKLFSSPPCQTD